MASAKASAAALATTALASTAFVLGPGRAVSTSSSSLRGSAASQRPVSSTEVAFSGSGVGLLGLGAGAAALLAATQHARGRGTQKSAVTVCAFENELGVQAPVGFWDPAKLTADGDAAIFARRRGVELKHGRIAMLAAMGYITPELTGKFPGYLSPSTGLQYQDIPNGLAAISKVPSLGWAQIFGYAAFCETSQDQSKGTTGEVGNFGFKVLTSSDPEAKSRKLAAEIANSRLAMMAIIGMFFQDGLTGSAWGDWANYTASPLRAFENELGVQAPLGFWDPAGFTADGDVYSFKRRRSVEIKHGRICMLATMGYITPEITGKFGGFLSPSEKLAFADIPNGLAALGKVPFLGWIQMAGYAGFTEIQARYDADINERNEPGNMGWKPPLLSTNDPETRTRRLNAEIANGRLAMMAIMGMFFQDGLTGSAWGDWALYTASPLRAKVARNFYGGDATSASRSFDPANELGVQDPVGFWDPLGLAADKDEATFKRRRAVEIKHGRISMYATIGYIVPEYFKFPGYLSPSLGLKFADVPNGLSALSKVPVLGGAQIIAFAGLIETTGFFQAESTTNGRGPREGAFAMQDSTETGEPGNYGVGFPNFLGKVEDPEARKSKLAAELANGRLAMMAIIGMFFQDGLTGSAWGDWATYTASPLRAFESELGVQAPVGFWDPVGFTSDGDVAKFKRRRSVELKHGRICMMATMGYITPEVVGKLPGYLSPSAGLKFADIPNGLAAISKVPTAGWAQIAAYFGFVEFSGGFSDYKTGTPGDYGFKVLTSSDPEEKTKKLSAEIANGRLAMVAIIGMFFQDGLTGSAWGDWALYTASPLRAKVARNYYGGDAASAPRSFDPANELGVQDPVGFTRCLEELRSSSLCRPRGLQGSEG